MKKKPKEKRRLLFKKSKPFIRPYQDSDFWVLWAAYDLGSFKGLKEGCPKEEFKRFIDTVRATNSSCLLIEDDCRYFKDKRGPIAFVTIKNDGWKVQPQIDFFRWATLRMKLRAIVAGFKLSRYSKDIGVCVVTALKNSMKLMNKAESYGVIFSVGRIPGGNAMGDEFIYSVRGRKEIDHVG